MKIARAAFINVVQCGGSTPSASYGKIVGNRPGECGFEIDLVELQGMLCIRLRKDVAGKHHQAHVPIFNVSFFEPMNDMQLAELKKIEDEKAAAVKKVKDDAEALAKAAKK